MCGAWCVVKWVCGGCVWWGGGRGCGWVVVLEGGGGVRGGVGGAVITVWGSEGGGLSLSEPSGSISPATELGKGRREERSESGVCVCVYSVCSV